ncbi:MAG: ABC transporter ATP-binding protein [Bacteroidetes bacterium]|nr:ABC transporter ATP-binding protein [Bacteroidota bacterium]MBT4401082.1 ABC transporter ATP-binding protein [Bacteroidota bacterium]MBT4408636.1 ABC transporter ATP-binding protein [Bacteroidota bacterium]MBT7092230.1 ABC transporter ATP-binding protein [Bacteroidota bacterium]MBT7465504.1 ABC transporter ATP-binding protein [Bacteroidota bacterium]
MVDIKNVTRIFKSFEVETRALNDVTLRVDEGDFIAIMGPSGCGKSTLLHILGLLDEPDHGQYIFNGMSAFPASIHQRNLLLKSGLGFVFQKFNLIDDLTIFDNVQLPLFYKKWSAKKRKDRVNEVLDRMGIGHRSMHRPQQLSGGQQQRAAVARAIVGDPLLILADEPTGNLDSKNGEQVMELLAELNQEGKTIIMVTHSQIDAAYAHRIVGMRDGGLS